MSAPLASELRTKHSVSLLALCKQHSALAQVLRLTQPDLLSQVRAVPIRKDDEVTVVRGTYKVRL